MEVDLTEIEDVHKLESDFSGEEDVFQQFENKNFVPVRITWNDIHFQVDIRKQLKPKVTKVILNGIYGDAKPGKLLAILGGSGSGKTSLLNVISGRIMEGTTQGQVLLHQQHNNKTSKMTEDIMKTIAGYVTQDDHLFQSLTVRETLTYSALLRLTDMTEDQKKQQVEAVIQELRLTKVADSKIGGEFVRGISGGEKRRVSIGIQLLTNPSVLFLDEPTSGLDSTTAHHIVSTLVKLAKKNRTIICTIHQPRSDIFAMFDQVMLLSQGELVYFGDAKQMTSYFSSVGFECPIYSNPADFALDLISVDTKNEDTTSQTRERLDVLVQAFSQKKVEPVQEVQNIVPSRECKC